MLTAAQSMDLAVVFRHSVQQVHPPYNGVRIPYALSITHNQSSSQPLSTDNLRSHCPDHMASRFCDLDDPRSGALHHRPRFAQEGPHDRQGLPARYRPDRCHVLSVAHLR